MRLCDFKGRSNELGYNSGIANCHKIDSILKLLLLYMLTAIMINMPFFKSTMKQMHTGSFFIIVTQYYAVVFTVCNGSGGCRIFFGFGIF